MSRANSARTSSERVRSDRRRMRSGGDPEQPDIPGELEPVAEQSTCLGTPEDHLLDLPRQREVLVGDPARRMRLELDPDLAPGHGQVGMMPGGFAEVANGVDQQQG